MQVIAYLAGPDVFLPNAAEHAAAKVAICRRHGIEGLPPLNEDIEAALALPPDQAWRAIFHKDLRLMGSATCIIANLTPFRGASADAGTLVELGWFLGRDMPVYGYTNSSTSFAARSREVQEALPDLIQGMQVEGFGLTDNLMIPGAVMYGGHYPIVIPPSGQDAPFDSLEVFEACVTLVAATSF